MLFTRQLHMKELVLFCKTRTFFYNVDTNIFNLQSLRGFLTEEPDRVGGFMIMLISVLILLMFHFVPHNNKVYIRCNRR